MNLKYIVFNKKTNIAAGIIPEDTGINEDKLYKLPLLNFENISYDKLNQYKYNQGTSTLEFFEKEVDQNLIKLLAQSKRESLFSDSDKAILKYLSEKDLVEAGLLSNTTLTKEQFLQWRIYQQKLRDLSMDDVDSIIWPDVPN